MKTEVLQSWQSFESAIDAVRREYGEFRAEAPDGRSIERQNRVLFRGQSDATWLLRTTLERKLNRPMDVTTYAGHAARTVFEIETYTGARWNVPPRPELEQEIQDRSNTFDVHLPNYDFLVYLRHHGFASPLLDWTESPYIAAYFAYAEAGSAGDPGVRDRGLSVRANHGRSGWGRSQANGAGKSPSLGTIRRSFAPRRMESEPPQFIEKGLCAHLGDPIKTCFGIFRSGFHYLTVLH